MIEWAGAPPGPTRRKLAAASRAGVEVRRVPLDRPTEEALVQRIAALNEDPEVDGIFLPYPVPPPLRLQTGSDAIVPSKDVDGAGAVARRLLAEGGRYAHAPASAVAVVELLDAVGQCPLAGRRVEVRHDGEPFVPGLLHLLTRAGARVSVPPRWDADQEPGEIDVLIACGAPASSVIADAHPHLCVVDACYGRGVGAVRFGPSGSVGSHVPAVGGVGPATVAVLLRQTTDAAERGAATSARGSAPG